MHFKAIIVKRYHYFKRDVKSLICEIFLPIVVVIVGLLLMTIKFAVDSPPLLLNSSIYSFSLQETYGVYSGVQSSVQPIMNNIPSVSWAFAQQTTASTFNDYSFSMKTRQKVYDVFFSNITSSQFSYYAFCNSIFFDGTVVAVNAVN